MKNQTKSERTSDRELVVSRIIHAPPRLVFDAWTKPELFKQWWVPKSAPIALESCEMDIRAGGTYRLRFNAGSQSMEFFGKYLEVTPCSRLVWTNEEGGGADPVITTVTFEETDGATRVSVLDLYPSKKMLDEAIASDSTGALPEQLEQLDALLRTLN